MHTGRIKPIDTLAREEVKQIFGRETIKLHESDETGENKVVATWGPSPRFTTGRSGPSTGTTSRSSWSNTCR